MTNCAKIPYPATGHLATPHLRAHPNPTARKQTGEKVIFTTTNPSFPKSDTPAHHPAPSPAPQKYFSEPNLSIKTNHLPNNPFQRFRKVGLAPALSRLFA
jgi:hypothetical protein